MKRNFLLLIILLFACYPAMAEIPNQINDGKIYTVVYVLASILIGLFAYLFYLDRKLSKIENQINNESQTSKIL